MCDFSFIYIFRFILKQSLYACVYTHTATVPDDFLGHSGHPLTLTDDTDIHINVPIVADSAYELTETFFANLSLVSPISDRIILDPSSVPISIVDDDGENDTAEGISAV